MIQPLEFPPRTFTIDRCLGRGGFGEVYRATMSTQAGVPTFVALKVLRRDIDPGGQALKRLRDEGRMLARLNHPTILRVHDFVVLDGRIGLVTELVEGLDLEHCLKGEGALGPRALVEGLGLVASALDAAYNAPVNDGRPLRLVHRDIKPSNIRLSRHGEIKLLDFGIAHTDELTREAKTMTDMMVGSPPYMAPERFLDNRVLPASDVFSLGATLLEGLAGRRTFDMPVTMLASHAVDRTRYEMFVKARLAEVPPETPAAVVELARELLSYDPSDRPDAGALSLRCDDLAGSLEGPTLARWARERVWFIPPDAAAPVPSDVGPAEFEGRVMSDTMARERPEQEAPRPSTQRSWRRPLLWVLGSVTVVSLAVAGGSLFGVLGLGVAWQGFGPRPAPPIAVEPIPASAPVLPSVEPTPSEPPPSEPTSAATAPEPPSDAPSPAPTTDRGRPVVRPAAPPTPAPPDPAPVVRPVAAAPAPALASGSAQVAWTGDVRPVLVRGAERVQVPGPVPAGTWQIHAAFGSAPEGPTQTTIDLVAGTQRDIDCNNRMRRCTVK